jgi:hypothetical protein
MRRRLRGLTDHPILQLELRRVRRWKWWSLPRLGLISLLLVLLLALPGTALGLLLAFAEPSELSSSTTWEMGGLFACCPMSTLMTLLRLAVTWLAPAIAAISIARERELGTWNLLRTTPLTSADLVLGKLGGCLGLLAPGWILMLLLTPFQIGWSMTTSALGIVGTMLLPYNPSSLWPLIVLNVSYQLPAWSHLALHLAIGLFISALSNSSGLAVALSYAGVLIVRITFGVIGGLMNLSLVMLLDPMLSGSTWGTFPWPVLLLPVIPFLAELLLANALIGAAILCVRWR